MVAEEEEKEEEVLVRVLLWWWTELMVSMRLRDVLSMWLPTDGWTDRQTDTPSYRDARTHLKTRQ